MPPSHMNSHTFCHTQIQYNLSSHSKEEVKRFYLHLFVNDVLSNVSNSEDGEQNQHDIDIEIEPQEDQDPYPSPIPN